MKKTFAITALMLFCATISMRAQLSPHDAAKAMGRGINMGNTLEGPDEGVWGNPAVVASNLDDYKNAGFQSVRLPITWDTHTDNAPPYSINAAWLNRIEQIVDWGLSRHLVIIINTMHEGWIKSDYSAKNIARFDSIWSQIATRFRNKSDSLLFEVINEPYPLSLANVNDLNARTIQTIRKTNPTRIVLFSGNNYSNSDELVAATIPSDNFIIGYYHSYDP
jgi:aryl-phospho-beta-D-glucosidase BglC (GH1 family)